MVIAEAWNVAFYQDNRIPVSHDHPCAALGCDVTIYNWHKPTLTVGHKAPGKDVDIKSYPLNEWFGDGEYRVLEWLRSLHDGPASKEGSCNCGCC